MAYIFLQKINFLLEIIFQMCYITKRVKCGDAGTGRQARLRI